MLVVLHVGSAPTEPVDVHKQCHHYYDYGSCNAVVPTQVIQTGQTKQTHGASNTTQDGSSGKVAS